MEINLEKVNKKSDANVLAAIMKAKVEADMALEAMKKKGGKGGMGSTERNPMAEFEKKYKKLG